MEVTRAAYRLHIERTEVANWQTHNVQNFNFGLCALVNAN